ncbi:hypothetical protein V1511DRAFT_153730 [Dipodascopsis uninucleata]
MESNLDEDKSGVESLARVASRMAESRPTDAATLYTAALDRLRRNGNCVNMTWLDCRAVCWLRCGQYDRALEDAETMIRLDSVMGRVSGRGYLIAGRAYQAKCSHNIASEILASGLENLLAIEGFFKREILPSTSFMSNTVETNAPAVKIDGSKATLSIDLQVDDRIFFKRTVSRDPLTRLPLEIIERIFCELPFIERIHTQLVSHLWRDFLISSPRLWQSLDFRSCSHITTEIVSACVERAHGAPIRVKFSSLDHSQATEWFKALGHSVDLLSFTSLDMPPNLMKLSYERDSRLFNGLRSLCVHAHIFESAIQFIGQGALPALEVFECVLREVSGANLIGLPNNDVDFPAQPRIKKFRLATNRGWRLYVDHRALNRFLALLPGLEVLELVSVFTRSWAPAGQYYDRTDFRHNPSLKTVVLMGTWLERMPTLSPTVSRLVVSGTTMMPRTILHRPDGEGIVYDSTFIGENSQADSTEYSSIMDLDLADSVLLIETKLFSILSRCSADRLRRLNLHYCPLRFNSSNESYYYNNGRNIYNRDSTSSGTEVVLRSSSMSNARMEPFSRTQSIQISELTSLCPNLEELIISKNASVTDIVMYELKNFSKLKVLDVSETPITSLGPIYLLIGDEIPPHEVYSSTIDTTFFSEISSSLAVTTENISSSGLATQSAATSSRLAYLKSLLPAEDKRAISLRRLFLNGCSLVSNDTCFWIEDVCGVSLQAKLSDPNPLKRKR